MSVRRRSAELPRRAGRHAAAGGLLRRVAGLLLRVVGIGGGDGDGVAAAEEEDVIVGSGGGVQRAAARVGSGTDGHRCLPDGKEESLSSDAANQHEHIQN